MTDHEAKAREILLDAFTKNGAKEQDGVITFEFKISDLEAAIASALRHEASLKEASCPCTKQQPDG